MFFFSTWQRYAILGMCLVFALLALPNVLPKPWVDRLPSSLVPNQVNLGLDLRGGSYILLEIDSDALIKERLEVLADDARQRLRAERIAYRDLKAGAKAVTFALVEAGDRDKALDQLKGLAQPIVSALSDGSGNLGGKDLDIDINAEGQGRMVLTEAGVLAKKRSAIQQSIEIVRRRVDQTGVAESSIQAQGADRILVQLPGVGDPKHIVQLIGTTAK